MRRYIIRILLVSGILAFGAGYFFLTYSYSTGIRSGKLVKLSKMGMFLKTYEGTLDLGSGDFLTWQFSVHDNDLGDALVKHTGRFITLEYRELLWKVFYQTNYDIVSWRLEKLPENDRDLFCRLVHLIEKNNSVVEFLRKQMESENMDLLQEAKACR